MRRWYLWIVVFVVVGLLGCYSVAAGESISSAEQSGNGPTLYVTSPQDGSVVRLIPVRVSGTAISSVGITVNGVPLNLDGMHFSTRVELEPGANSIEVVARDALDREVSKCLTVIYVP